MTIDDGTLILDYGLNTQQPRGLLLLCPRRFCPHGVTDVSVDDLRKSGIEAVILDLDNTLVEWQRHDVSTGVNQWLAALKESGMKLCLLSNTRFGRRLKKMSEELGIPYVRQAMKPSKKGFHAAMELMGADPSKTVMIGDQMFTDVWGANRSGIFSIMVPPMAHREFFGTKISRMAERVLLSYFRRKGHI